MQQHKHLPSVSASIVEGVLIIKIPHLPRRLSRSAFLCEAELYAALNGCETVPELPQKLLRFISIYSSDTAAHVIVDHDNQDIKRVIDIITDYTLGGDSATNCSLRQDTFLLDDLPAGTYILVLPLTNSDLKRCEALELIRHFTAKDTHKKLT
jgi:hypothetical protein